MGRTRSFIRILSFYARVFIATLPVYGGRLQLKLYVVFSLLYK